MAESRWTIPADLERVAPLVVDAARFLERHGIHGHALFTAQLALEEIVTNAVRHAYAAGSGGQRRAGRGLPEIRVQLRLDDRRLGDRRDGDAVWIIVEDQGRPFDPLHDAPEPDLDSPLSERRPGGLGLFLVRTLVQDLDYVRAGATNRVTMRVGPAAA